MRVHVQCGSDVRDRLCDFLRQSVGAAGQHCRPSAGVFLPLNDLQRLPEPAPALSRVCGCPCNGWSFPCLRKNVGVAFLLVSSLLCTEQLLCHRHR